jgi:hypothetical protein
MRDHVDHEHEKMALQQWYNADKGRSFQKELLSIIMNTANSDIITNP